MDTALTKPIMDNDLLRLSAERPVEIVHGEPVPKMAANYTHVYIIMNLYDLLKPFVKNHGLGHVIIDGLHYVLTVDARGIKDSRLPDLSFIRKGRMGEDFNPNKPFQGAPDLAVEVVSPSEDEDSIVDKIRAYLAAGTEQVWVVYPLAQELHVYTKENPKSIRAYTNEDMLEADTLFPNLKIPLKDLFVVPVW